MKKQKSHQKTRMLLTLKLIQKKRQRIKDDDEANSRLQKEGVVTIVVIVSPRQLLLILFRNIISRNKLIIRQESHNLYSNRCNI